MATQLQKSLQEAAQERQDYKTVLLILLAELAPKVSMAFCRLVTDAVRNGTMESMVDLHREILTAIADRHRRGKTSAWDGYHTPDPIQE